MSTTPEAEAAGAASAGVDASGTSATGGPVRTPQAQRPLPRSSPSQQQPIVRPRALPRATAPGNVPAPEHHHLPGWVRRAYGQARPVLADLLGVLDGEARSTFQRRVDEFTAAVSAGRFSLAWQYPALIDEGMVLFEQHRREYAQISQARRAVDTARRRASDHLREASLGADVAARLSNTLRTATDVEVIRAVDAELTQAAGVARSSQEKRRDREIQRTRARINATGPRAADAPAESWQDVLRRFADSQGPDPG
jgi:hypothetical protein